MAIGIKELSFVQSAELLTKFQLLENSFGSDWYDCEKEEATYIWLMKDIKNPLGFLSYRVLILPNKIDFIYIVKIYVLEIHRGTNPSLIEGERVSEILFRQIDRKGVNILTLESACKELDIYYESLGFKYNKEISEEFAKIIGTGEEIMYRKKEDINMEVSDEMKELFGMTI